MKLLEDRLRAFGNHVWSMAQNHSGWMDSEYLEAITADLLELVGKDEHDKSVDTTYQEWRNELRFELRQAIRQYGGDREVI